MYHPHTTFLKSKTGNHRSYGWSSIQAGKELLQRGMRARIGNGKTIKIWSDPWLPTLPPRPAAGPVLDDAMTVSDLWDTFEWDYTQNAEYTVRSGYWVATHEDLLEEEAIQPPPGSTEVKQAIWKLHVAPKIKHFLWRCVTEALATNTRLRSRNIDADPICQRCCIEEETIHHIMFNCSYTQSVWRSANIIIGNQWGPPSSFEDNQYRLIQLSKTQTTNSLERFLPFWIMWRLWKSRNVFLFQQKCQSPDYEARKGIQDATEWLNANETTENTNVHVATNPIQTSRRDSSQWNPPPEGWVKCNFDSCYTQGSPYTRSGWIIWECNGHIVLCGNAKLQSSTCSLHAEALGFLHALQVIWAHGLRYVWFESDSKSLVTLINNGEDHSLLGTLIYDIHHWMLKLPYCSLEFVNRERNSAADALASHVHARDPLFQSYTTPPSWLVNTLYYPYTI
ncbi:putative ribonuclease H domain, reverse transcriptase zinc-binding domain-containing protein [Arabidopsis thaliana]